MIDGQAKHDGSVVYVPVPKVQKAVRHKRVYVPRRIYRSRLVYAGPRIHAGIGFGRSLRRW